MATEDAWALLSQCLQTALRGLLQTVYRERSTGWERLPKEGGVLLVGNHLSYTDAIILAAFSPRPVRILGAAKLQRYRWIRLVFRLLRVIPVDAGRPPRCDPGVKRGASPG